MTILAHELLEMAKGMRVSLNDILPAVSAMGMQQEAETIRMMKENLENFENSTVRMAMANGYRQDAVSHASSFKEIVGDDADPADMTDEELRVALMAAESFLRRGYEYMISKNSYIVTIGGAHAAA